MTMLGIERDMQCHYFPSYFSTRDVNLNGSCSIWPTSTNAVMNGHYYNENLDPYMAYKDKFKHIMLQHEAEFKSQVHELHRVYNKQKELMLETKRIEFRSQHSHLENSTAIRLFPEASFEHKQKASIVQTQSNTELNCKKIGKKILDLELPAYEYIDSDTEEYSAKEMNPSEIPSYVDNEKCFADLNEPIELEEEVENQYNGNHIKGIDLNAISPCYSPNMIAQSSKDRDFDCNSTPKFHVDLNLCINEAESLQKLEFRPPENLEDEIALRAAEAIVSISSLEVQKVDSLYWFAKIASSVVNDPESQFGMVLTSKKKNLDLEIDYFEEMTLQLEEISVEDYFLRPSGGRDDATCPPGRARRGRQKRKDFQSEILPSLATLSRYEVNEDLQEIGGLIKAARLSRRTGGNRGSRSNRRKVERNLLDWGKITRGRRGRRLPASNPRLILHCGPHKLLNLDH